jgi:hypothetical protein
MLKRFLFVFITLIVGFFIFPILLVVLNKDNPEFLILNRLSQSLQKDDDSKTILSIHNFVSNNTISTRYTKPYNGNTLKSLLHKKLYCDQQVMVCISLSEYLGLKGRLIFLRGNDSISHHTIGEIISPSNAILIDPYYSFIPKNKGKYLTNKDLKNKTLQFKTKYYQNLTALHYPAEIKNIHKGTFIQNQIKSQKIFVWWFKFYRKLASKTYLYIIEKQTKISSFEKNQIESWFDN